MYRRRYKSRYTVILDYIKKRLHYKRQLNKLIGVLIILILLLILKILNNSITTNIIRIIHNGVNYEFSIKEDGERILNQGRRLLVLPEKALSVLNLDAANKFPPPIEGTIYNPFGETRYLSGKSAFNNGVDIMPSGDKEPIAIENGLVQLVEDRGSKGYFVSIKHEDFVTVYGYMISVFVKEGERVELGDKIGTLGTNKDGNSYLHFETWFEDSPVNPMDYINFDRRL